MNLVTSIHSFFYYYYFALKLSCLISVIAFLIMAQVLI